MLAALTGQPCLVTFGGRKMFAELTVDYRVTLQLWRYKTDLVLSKTFIMTVGEHISLAITRLFI